MFNEVHYSHGIRYGLTFVAHFNLVQLLTPPSAVAIHAVVVHPNLLFNNLHLIHWLSSQYQIAGGGKLTRLRVTFQIKSDLEPKVTRFRV